MGSIGMGLRLAAIGHRSSANKDPYFHAAKILSTGPRHRIGRPKCSTRLLLFVDGIDTFKAIGVKID